MNSWEGSQLNEAKAILAYELTNLVHGKEEADKAKEASQALFGGGSNNENMPKCELSDTDFKEDGTIDLMAILVKGGMANTRSEARRSIEQGGVSVNDERITDVYKTYTKEYIGNTEMIVRKGKKVFKKIVLS